MGKLEVYAILDKVANDQTEFILFYTKSFVCENSKCFFAIAWIRFQVVQSIFVCHNFHVRKECNLHHPKLDLATFDGTTTTTNTCFFLNFFYLLSKLPTL
jgi:hypothetical protein